MRTKIKNWGVCVVMVTFRMTEETARACIRFCQKLAQKHKMWWLSERIP
jgi:hypothetical protein